MQEGRVSLWCIIVLSALSGVVEMGYSIEGAYAIPVILAAGIPLKYTSLMLSLSPLLGLIIQPFIGSASDQCKCSWGRRRPFVLLLGFIIVACCGSIPYYFYVKAPYSEYIIPSCVVACIMLYDLSIGALLIPAKAIMLDLVPPSQENSVNLISSTGVGVFTCLGYGLGAVDWTLVTGKDHSIETQSEIVFGVTAGVFIVVLTISLVSLREKSSLITFDSIPAAEINNTKIISELNYGSLSTSSSDITVPDFTKDRRMFAVNKTSCMICVNPFTLFKNSIVDIVQYCYCMSRHMWVLFFTFTMAYAADFAFTYSFTIFVGMVVYDGDSQAPVESESFKRYSEGVRMGSLGLAIGNFVNIFVSLIFEKFVKYTSLKTLFLLAIAPFTCGTCLLMYFHQLPAALVLGSTYGPYLGTCASVAFGLMANYKVRPTAFN